MNYYNFYFIIKITRFYFKYKGEVEMIQVTWKNLIMKLTVWLLSEILLTFLGLDNLADYSEFIFSQQVSFYNHVNSYHQISMII